MDSDVIAAAIMAAGFVNALRQPLNAGQLDTNVREKFVEYLAFVREQKAAAQGKARKKG